MWGISYVFLFEGVSFGSVQSIIGIKHKYVLDFALGKKNMLTFCGLFVIFLFSLNLRGHKESTEEEVLYGSQPAEGKCHILQLSQLHLLISQFKFIQSRFFFYSRLCAMKD